MAAPVFQLSQTNGSGATVTDNITSIALASLDSNIVTTPAIQTANPITVGNNSYEAWLRLKLTTIASNSVSAFGVYFSSTAPTDNGGSSSNITPYYGTNGTYATPVASISTVATTTCSTTTASPGTSFTAPANTLNAYSGYTTLQLRTLASSQGGNTTFANPFVFFAYTYS